MIGNNIVYNISRDIVHGTNLKTMVNNQEVFNIKIIDQIQNSLFHIFIMIMKH